MSDEDSLKTSMNLPPMSFRFFCGSVIFSRSVRNSFSASITRSSASKWSRKVSSTNCLSFLRSRPLSTKMHVSCLPIAFARRAATTEESTPPERPQMTFLSPTCSLILAIWMSMKLDIFHDPWNLHSWNRKFLRISWPCGVCVTSGWNWRPKKGFVLCLTAAYGHVGVDAIVSKMLVSRSWTWSPCDIHTVVLSGTERSNPLLLFATLMFALPYSRSVAGFIVAPNTWQASCMP